MNPRAAEYWSLLGWGLLAASIALQQLISALLAMGFGDIIRRMK